MADQSLARSFETIGAEYDRFRPAFPDAAADLILPDRVPVALDLGAGTGKFTTQLLSRAESVIAVEPSDPMRAVLATNFPTVQALAGTAERIPAASSSVNVVTVAQAFHWFDRDKASAEIHRVLAPGGILGLLWNHSDPSCDWDRACAGVLGSALGDTATATATATAELPGFILRTHREFGWTEQIHREDYLGRWGTVSSFLVASAEERAAYLRRLNEILDASPETAGRAVLTLPQITDVYVYSAGENQEAPPR